MEIFLNGPFISFACSLKLSLATCGKNSKRFRFSDLCNEGLRPCKAVDYRLLLVGCTVNAALLEDKVTSIFREVK
jgi:hypothetical protein